MLGMLGRESPPAVHTGDSLGDGAGGWPVALAITEQKIFIFITLLGSLQNKK
jgi:hypothetical protein